MLNLFYDVYVISSNWCLLLSLSVSQLWCCVSFVFCHFFLTIACSPQSLSVGIWGSFLQGRFSCASAKWMREWIIWDCFKLNSCLEFFSDHPGSVVGSLQTDVRAGARLQVLWGDIFFSSIQHQDSSLAIFLVYLGMGQQQVDFSFSLMLMVQSFGVPDSGRERPLSDRPPWVIPGLCLLCPLPYDAIKIQNQVFPVWQMFPRHKSASAFCLPPLPGFPTPLNLVLNLDVPPFLAILSII